MKIFTITFVILFIISCGEAPVGWDGALVSEDGSVSDNGGSGSSGDGDGDGGEEPPPPEETKLFQMDLDNMNVALAAFYTDLGVDPPNYSYRNLEQSGWCFNPNDGSVSDQNMTVTLDAASITWFYNYNFTGGTVANQILSGSCNLSYGPGGDDYGLAYTYELRFDSGFTLGDLYLDSGEGLSNDHIIGQIIHSGTCE